MSLIDAVKKLDGLAYVNDEGEPRTLKLLPGLPPQQVPPDCPAQLRSLLEFCRGIEGAEHVSEGIDFSGSLSGQFLEEFSPQGISLACDGCGNSWTLDPPTGWIFFLCHDAPVVVYQFANLEELLEQLPRQPRQSDLGDILQSWVGRIWRENPATLNHAEAIQKDPVLAHFAKEQGEDWHFIDLRNPRPGDGFSWGRYGAETELRRHPEHCIVALRKPAPRPSLWARLWKKA